MKDELELIGQMKGYERVNRVYGAGGGITYHSCELRSHQGTCKVYALNPMPDGTCRTIKNQYFKNSVSNFRSSGTFGASGVLVVYGS